MFNPEEFGAAMGELVRDAIRPLQEEIAVLKKQLAERTGIETLVTQAVTEQIKAIPAPRDGKSLTMEDVAPMIEAQVKAAIEALPVPEPGKSVTLADVRPVLDEAIKVMREDIGGAIADVRKRADSVLSEVSQAAGALRQPADGKSVTLDDVRPVLDVAIKQLRADADEAIKEPMRLVDAGRDALFKALGELRQPKDGKSVTLEEVQPIIDKAIKSMQEEVRDAAERISSAGFAERAAIQKTLSEIRQPEDGKSVTLADVRPVLDQAIADIRAAADQRIDAAIKAIPVPKDGESFTIDDAEVLLRNHWSTWELDFERRAVTTLEKAVDRLPKPRDGLDGLGFDDLSVEHDGGRSITLKFQRGEAIKAFPLSLPVVLDKGIYSPDGEYAPGDGVTWGGSYWIAQRATKAKPDSHDSGFRLAVKKGRDGKNGLNGIDKIAPVRLRG